MERVLGKDLERLKTLAFKRAERCGPLLERFHKNRSRIDSHPAASLIWRLYAWLCAPLSLWPIDFDGLTKHLFGLFETTGQVENDVLLLLDMIGNPPEDETQAAVAEFEHIVETGNYDHLVKTPVKFVENETLLKEDEDFATAWDNIKTKWDVKPHQNTRGVIRRRLSQERNLRGDWNFDWQDAKKKFDLFFDAMCYRWKLYGMQYDEPLLLKVSVNPTPHGTMIVIPRHLSLDPGRDLHWTKIRKLHRAHGARRQGKKLSGGRMEKRKEALLVKRYWDEAGKKRIRGDRRYDYVHQQMKKDGRTDHCWVNRLLRIARKRKKKT
jgi:hypothetical protein